MSESTADVMPQDVYEWMGVLVEVQAVALDQSTCWVVCTQPSTGTTWRKQQPLPLPPEARLVSRL